MIGFGVLFEREVPRLSAWRAVADSSTTRTSLACTLVTSSSPPTAQGPLGSTGEPPQPEGKLEHVEGPLPLSEPMLRHGSP